MVADERHGLVETLERLDDPRADDRVTASSGQVATPIEILTGSSSYS
jgi:hypothetical protein